MGIKTINENMAVTGSGRRITRQINCGRVKIGGDAPISIQSMTNTDTRDVAATISQIRELEEAGCDIVRCAVSDTEAAEAIKEIKKGVRIPVIADIHFDYRLALSALYAGADKIRINPGNIGGADKLAIVADRAHSREIPIRIGVNAGSLERDLLEKYGGPTAEAVAESALRSIEFMENIGFSDLVISMKVSDVSVNRQAHLLVAKQTDHPFHVGLTEAGIGERALIKSSVGIGALLLEGIGDTIRVSLTGDPVREVEAAQEILKAVGLMPGAVNLIACPTCGRCRVNLEKLAGDVDFRLQELSRLRRSSRQKSLTVAVMGCAVNGPGEASYADIGVACGEGKGVIFERGVIGQTVSESEIVNVLMEGVERLWK